MGKRPQEVVERAPLHVNAALHVCWAPRGWREQPSRVNTAPHARWAPRQVMESLSAHSSSFSGAHVWGASLCSHPAGAHVSLQTVSTLSEHLQSAACGNRT